MDLVQGVPLATVWPRMNVKERLEVVKSVFSLQKAWLSVSFNRYGSLYHAQDLNEAERNSSRFFDEKGQELALPEYGIGQSTSRDMFDDGRDRIVFDRGPCMSLSRHW